MPWDNSHIFKSLLEELIDYHDEINRPEWQAEKSKYYEIYCRSLMKKIYELDKGTGFHVWSLLPKEYGPDHITLCLNPDVDALIQFCISLHSMQLYTEWAQNETHWIVFIFKK